MTECDDAFGAVSVCPTKLPRVDAPYKIRAFGTSNVALLDVSSSAPYPGMTRRNAPPRFAHVVIKVGSLRDALAFPMPTETGESPPSRKESTEPIHLGTYSWGTKHGTLVLAPRYPRGGIDGGHLVFVWNEGTNAAVMSLHAWVPLRDGIETLKHVVSSIPAD